MAKLQLQGVRKSYGTVEVVKGIDLTVNEREFVVFVGPSGCGKSTLLRMIAGLEEITDGTLSINGERVNEVAPDKRGLAMVFQSYALYPHMSVADNMAFALRLAGVPKATRDGKVRDAARVLQLEPFLDRKPGQLSGGQRQRVAIGRAIVREPRAFLFDEPLSNLDASLRVQMRIEIARLHRALGATTVYVTHDQVEAMTMADRIVVLNGGIVEQVGTPLELYHAPANLFVAGFIGAPKMNVLPGTVSAVRNGTAAVALNGSGHVEVPVERALGEGQPVSVGIRPEHLSVSQHGPIAGAVEIVEHLGDETLAYVSLAPGRMVTVRVAPDFDLEIGDRVGLAARSEAICLFGEDGRALRTPPPRRARTVASASAAVA